MISLQGRKLAFVSLGCDKNLLDSEVMLGLVNKEGCVFTQNQNEAEIILINTCGFVLDAAQESVDAILHASSYKQNGVCKVLLVTGCLAQRYKEELFDELPCVDAVVGVTEYAKIVAIIRQALGGGQHLFVASPNNEVEEEALLGRLLSTPKHYAYLKIAEGCDNCCTYCTIPSIRGSFRSRKLESLCKEATQLAQKGVKELILVAQDTSLYGKDLFGEPSLHILLRELAKIEGIEWIRLLYCYPEHITDDLVEEMATNKKVLHYVDMPIQHASDTVLARMARKTTQKRMKAVIDKLRKHMPDVVLRTTLIVGFPGETQQEYYELLQFVKDVGFERLGVFTYSKEEGTPAYKLKNHLLQKTKENRKHKLMSLQSSISKEKLQQKIGQTMEAFVEAQQEDGSYVARTYMDSPNIDGVLFVAKPTKNSHALIIGQKILVKINDATEYDLLGELV